MIDEKKLDELASEYAAGMCSCKLEAEYSFIRGYRAAEKQAEELVRALDCIVNKPLGWTDAEYKYINGLIGKWRERGV